MPSHIALLRGINVGGNRKVPMADLRALSTALGHTDVQTYIASGNLLLTTTGDPASVESTLEQAILKHFGFAVDVLVRTTAAWPEYLHTNPMRAASEAQPNLVMLALAKSAIKPDAVAALRAKAVVGERIEAAGEALWFHYPDGMAKSKLSPALIDRLVGSPVTARNWRTVQKLAELTASR